VSLNETGRVDVGLIAAQLDVSEDEAIAQLGDRIWLDPAGEVWRTAEDYLSGDVVQKLEDAVARPRPLSPIGAMSKPWRRSSRRR
jgi:N12 class adenine-specific DNA methylase